MATDKNERLRYLNALFTITQAVQNTPSLEEALAIAVKTAVRTVGAETGILWLRDNQELIPAFVIHGVAASDFSVLPYVKAAKKVIDQGASLILPKVHVHGNGDDDDGNSREASLDPVIRVEKGAFGSIVCMPLRSKGNTRGCFQLINKQGQLSDGGFSKEDVELCESVSSIAGIALEEKGLNIRRDRGQKPLVSLRNVEKEFRSGKSSLKVLKGISIDIYEHEFAVILGASGSGKSTLLKILGGMDNVTAGSIVVDGQNLVNASQKQLAAYRRHDIGFVFQSYYLLPNLTAKENLDIAAELAKAPLSTREVLEMISMQDRKRNYPSQLSGGQQQRISIGRAVVKRPKIILADEPTAALDYKTSVEVLEVMESIARKRISTVILITHNSEIAKMADRVIRISDGAVSEILVNMKPLGARDLKW